MKKLLPLLIAMLVVVCALPLSANALLVGDCDNDGKINSADAALILRHTVRINPLEGSDWYAADANGNGSVDSSDAAMVLRHVVALDLIEGEVSNLPPMIDSIALSETEIELKEDQSKTLTVSIEGDADYDLKLSVDNAKVVSVSLTGLSLKIQALAGGSAAVSVEDKISHRVATVQVEVEVVDEQLKQSIREALTYGSNNPTEQLVTNVYRFVTGLDKSMPYTKVILEGLKLAGQPYSAYDCSQFTNAAYSNAGYGSVICTGSQRQIKKFGEDGCRFTMPMTGKEPDCSVLKTGYVLLWADSSGRGNHSALYLGNINGQDYYLESANSCNGVRIREAWGTYSSYNMVYYAKPLG